MSVTSSWQAPWETLNDEFENKKSSADVLEKCLNEIAEQSKNDRLETIDFFNRFSHILNKLKFGQLPNETANQIAVRDFGSGNDWMSIADACGWTDTDQLKVLDYLSPKNSRLPLECFLLGKFRSESVTKLAVVLIKLDRFDLLHILKAKIELFLAKMGNDETLLITEMSSIPLANNSTNRIAAAETEPKLIEAIKPANQNSVAERIQLNLKRFHYDDQLENERISLFVTHTNDDYAVAEQLKEKLQQLEFNVLIQRDLDHFFNYDACYVVKEIIKQIDFTVPLVSKRYLSEIDPLAGSNQSRETDQLNVRYIFSALQNNMLHDQCLNAKIRPLLMDDAPRDLIREHLELRCGLRLWTDMDRFQNVLRKTKIILGN